MSSVAQNVCLLSKVVFRVREIQDTIVASWLAVWLPACVTIAGILEKVLQALQVTTTNNAADTSATDTAKDTA